MNKINKFLKLASLIAKFSTVDTDKGILTSPAEIAEGVEVYIEDENGEFIAAPDGDYETEESIITVKDGKVEKIEDKEVTEEPATETKNAEASRAEAMNEEFARNMRFYEEGYNELMQKIAKAVGENAYVIEAGDGWAIVSIWDDDEGEKFYRYTYSIDAAGQIVLGERFEVYPRFVTDEEAKQLDFAEQTPADEQAEDPKDAQIKELETKITELEGLLQDRDAVIEELTEKIKELQDEKAAPVEESVKMSATVRTQCYSEKDIPALKYFK